MIATSTINYIHHKIGEGGGGTHWFFHCMDESGLSRTTQECVHNQMVIVCLFFFFLFCFLDGVKEHSIRSLAHFRSPVFYDHVISWALQIPSFLWPRDLLGTSDPQFFMTTWSLGHFRSPVFMTTWSLGRTSHRRGPTFVVDWPEFRTTGDSWPKWWWPDWTSTHQWMDGWMDASIVDEPQLG